MTGGNFDSILALAADSYSEKEIFTGNGKTFECCISTAVQTSQIAKYQNALEQREKALKAKKTLDVVVPVDVVAGKEEVFPGWQDAGNGNASFPVNKTEEILTATTIETFVTDPQFTWAEAVVFGRINGSIALKIQKHVINWLQNEGLIESKNE